jgi:hypothetical protein
MRRPRPAWNRHLLQIVEICIDVSHTLATRNVKRHFPETSSMLSMPWAVNRDPASSGRAEQGAPRCAPDAHSGTVPRRPRAPRPEVAPDNRSAYPRHQAAVLCCAAGQRCSNCIELRYPSVECSLAIIEGDPVHHRVTNRQPWKQAVFRCPQQALAHLRTFVQTFPRREAGARHDREAPASARGGQRTKSYRQPIRRIPNGHRCVAHFRGRPGEISGLALRLARTRPGLADEPHGLGQSIQRGALHRQWIVLVMQ